MFSTMFSKYSRTNNIVEEIIFKLFSVHFLDMEKCHILLRGKEFSLHYTRLTFKDPLKDIVGKGENAW